jgi:hypothetical protein
MEQVYEDAKAKLMEPDGTPSRRYQAYRKYEEEYKRKVNDRNEAYQQALSNPMKLQTWPIIGKSYQDDIDQALNKWMTLGFKNEIENAIDTLTAQAGEEGNTLIARVRGL